MGVCPATAGRKKRVEVEFVELAGARHGHQLVGHLVGQQAHLRQGAVRVPRPGMRGGEFSFGTLLVGVGPIKNLLLDELACGQRFERGPRQIQVGLGGDGQILALAHRIVVQILVDAAEMHGVLERGLLFGDGFVLALEQLFGRVAPRAEVVLVEDHQIPVNRVHPLVFGLDVAGGVAPEQILKRAEVDQRLVGGDARRLDAHCARQVLPAGEVGV